VSPGGVAGHSDLGFEENVMLRFARTTAVAGALVVLAAAVRADEEKVSLDKLPKEVLAAVKAKFPKGELKGASKETEDGKTLYEVQLVDDGHKIDAEFTADGKIVNVEKEIAAKDLPKAVAEALESKYPKAEHKRVEEVVEYKDGAEQPAVYEVLLTTADGKKFEVVLAADGKIKKEEEKKPKKKD
jgi:uncharacterized membrane protein YkoI